MAVNYSTAFHGFRIATGSPTKSLTFLVTRVIPRSLAAAASMRSGYE